MSAFPESGRSDHWKITKNEGRLTAKSGSSGVGDFQTTYSYSGSCTSNSIAANRANDMRGLLVGFEVRLEHRVIMFNERYGHAN